MPSGILSITISISPLPFKGFELDKIDHAGAPVELGSFNEVDFQKENTEIDHSLALPGPAFNRTKLKLPIMQICKLNTGSYSHIRNKWWVKCCQLDTNRHRSGVEVQSLGSGSVRIPTWRGLAQIISRRAWRCRTLGSSKPEGSGCSRRWGDTTRLIN
jgi:hypothetical protein